MSNLAVSDVRDPLTQKVVVQISDVHIVGEGDLHDKVDTLDNLSQILELLESSSEIPDLLLFTGDLADAGEPAAYRRFKSVVESFTAGTGCPVLYMPGNHDSRAPFREELLGWDANEDPIDQVAWCGDLRIIALDSTVPGSHHGELDDGQLKWLVAELETHAPLGTIVALHHPPILGPSAFLNQLTMREPERLAKAIRESDVRMILAGHTHHVSAGVLGGVPVFVATATAYQMDVLASTTTALRGLPGIAFSRVDVTPDSMVATSITVAPRDEAIYEIDFATLKKLLGRHSVAEVQDAFHS